VQTKQSIFQVNISKGINTGHENRDRRIAESFNMKVEKDRLGSIPMNTLLMAAADTTTSFLPFPSHQLWCCGGISFSALYSVAVQGIS
jgi:hypothetical protein